MSGRRALVLALVLAAVPASAPEPQWPEPEPEWLLEEAWKGPLDARWDDCGLWRIEDTPYYGCLVLPLRWER